MACPPSIRFAIIVVLWLNGLVGVASFSLGCRRCALTEEMLSRCQSQPSNSRARIPTHSSQPRKRQSGLSRLFSSSPEMSEHRGIQRVLRFFRRLLIAPLRFFFFRPISYVMDLLADEIDLDDGTTESLQPTVSEIMTNPVVEEERSVQLDAVVAGVRLGDGKLEQEALEKQAENTVTPIGTLETTSSTEPSLPVTKSAVDTVNQKPKGKRWAVAAPGVDLTGDWELIVNEQFKHDYDRYLAELGQPILVRSVALGIISLTTEVTKQTDNGKSLLIRGQNVRGTWDRTLVASGAEVGVDDFVPLQIPVMSADSEKVEAESWWENDGRVHVSWLRGVTKYGGGAFESRRYLDGDTYVCESTFHPKDVNKSPNQIVWRFRRREVSG